VLVRQSQVTVPIRIKLCHGISIQSLTPLRASHTDANTSHGNGSKKLLLVHSGDDQLKEMGDEGRRPVELGGPICSGEGGTGCKGAGVQDFRGLAVR
jgi:hypothetical protein